MRTYAYKSCRQIHLWEAPLLHGDTVHVWGRASWEMIIKYTLVPKRVPPCDMRLHNYTARIALSTVPLFAYFFYQKPRSFLQIALLKLYPICVRFFIQKLCCQKNRKNPPQIIAINNSKTYFDWIWAFSTCIDLGIICIAEGYFVSNKIDSIS